MKIGRNEPCPCGSGKKFKHCHYTDNNVGVLEVISYTNHPDYENASGLFMYVPETHMLAETGEIYKVHIYSSVRELIENNDSLKQTLASLTCRLIRGAGDVAFFRGEPNGVPDDILIWFNVKEQHVMWFTVTQAKSYFGPMYEGRFGEVERQPWSRSGEETIHVN